MHRYARLVLLLVALVAVAASLQPAPANAIVCCTYSYRVTYYSDPAKTHYVGYCSYNDACTSDVICWGQQTSYYTVGPKSCCLYCGA
ncbi:MAG: hypothetical protein ACJ75H_19060 [Thermoanaerobaculia bacterium]